jgi:hypothetical protein
LDRHLDQVYDEGVIKTLSTATSTTSGTRTHARKTTGNQNSNAISNNVTFAYHRRYVLDVTNMSMDGESDRPKARLLHDRVKERYSSNIPMVPNVHFMEQRQWPRFSNTAKLKYMIPCDFSSENQNDVNNTRASTRPTKSWIGMWAREICLNAIDNLIDLQEIDRIATMKRDA